MKRDVLTILGCSSSLALMLAANPAQANQAVSPETNQTNNASFGQRELVFTAPDYDLALDNSNCTCVNSAAFEGENTDFTTKLGINQTVLNRIKLKCDCNACRNLVSELAESTI
ncbi:MAG: hypothetical protein SAL07_08905 [Oscillatoria sp. PMC 1051.18]|uniref:hypothetical protein n=1 Tax=Oscillatoria salina TaxID=331517 RepID=UPI0013BD391D|nr:hypothetical protein [Oscillatoria salina]MBZ8179155.1 hypothetical protein [Oscillatoria salina IIICB1]MEC4893284.1 hypothetical protein [Oscillatoria sp. PMC 1050.18]MEC5030018.1 hypothetical protein [Oscillatoria sp. PMC 1051.18]NET88060.1 hypothetical protein [Kamptonema sp. SIO1D9]